jgi:hypothetical protein
MIQDRIGADSYTATDADFNAVIDAIFGALTTVAQDAKFDEFLKKVDVAEVASAKDKQEFIPVTHDNDAVPAGRNPEATPEEVTLGYIEVQGAKKQKHKFKLFKDIFGKIRFSLHKVGSGFNNLGKAIVHSEAFEDLKEAKTAIVKFVRASGRTIKDAVSGAVKGIGRGIKGLWKRLKSAVKGDGTQRINVDYAVMTTPAEMGTPITVTTTTATEEEINDYIEDIADNVPEATIHDDLEGEEPDFVSGVTVHENDVPSTQTDDAKPTHSWEFTDATGDVIAQSAENFETPEAAQNAYEELATAAATDDVDYELEAPDDVPRPVDMPTTEPMPDVYHTVIKKKSSGKILGFFKKIIKVGSFIKNITKAIDTKLEKVSDKVSEKLQAAEDRVEAFLTSIGMSVSKGAKKVGGFFKSLWGRIRTHARNFRIRVCKKLGGCSAKKNDKATANTYDKPVPYASIPQKSGKFEIFTSFWGKLFGNKFSWRLYSNEKKTYVLHGKKNFETRIECEQAIEKVIRAAKLSAQFKDAQGVVVNGKALKYLTLTEVAEYADTTSKPDTIAETDVVADYETARVDIFYAASGAQVVDLTQVKNLKVKGPYFFLLVSETASAAAYGTKTVTCRWQLRDKEHNTLLVSSEEFSSQQKCFQNAKALQTKFTSKYGEAQPTVGADGVKGVIEFAQEGTEVSSWRTSCVFGDKSELRAVSLLEAKEDAVKKAGVVVSQVVAATYAQLQAGSRYEVDSTTGSVKLDTAQTVARTSSLTGEDSSAPSALVGGIIAIAVVALIAFGSCALVTVKYLKTKQELDVANSMKASLPSYAGKTGGNAPYYRKRSSRKGVARNPLEN